jgi:hypothetical protein
VHYMCVTGVLGTPTATDSGVAPDTTTPHFSEIDDTGRTNVIFKIDGTTVCCTNATNLPVATGVLGGEPVNAFLTITALGAATKDWEYPHIGFVRQMSDAEITLGIAIVSCIFTAGGS